MDVGFPEGIVGIENQIESGGARAKNNRKSLALQSAGRNQAVGDARLCICEEEGRGCRSAIPWAVSPQNRATGLVPFSNKLAA